MTAISNEVLLVHSDNEKGVDGGLIHDWYLAL